MNRTGPIPVHPVGDRMSLVIAMTMTIVKVRRTRRVVRKGPGMGSEQRMGRGMERRLRMGWGKGRGREKEMVKGKVLLNTPKGEMTSLVPLLCSCRRKCQMHTWTWRAN